MKILNGTFKYIKITTRMAMRIISGIVPNIYIIMFDNIYIETKLFDNRQFIY